MQFLITMNKPPSSNVQRGPLCTPRLEIWKTLDRDRYCVALFILMTCGPEIYVVILLYSCIAGDIVLYCSAPSAIRLLSDVAIRNLELALLESR